MPVADDDVNTTLSPSQKVVALAADMPGVAGIGFTVTPVPALAALSTPAVVTFTV